MYSGLMFSLFTSACWLNNIRVFEHFELHCWATFDNVDFNFSTFLFRLSSSWDFCIFPFLRFSSLLFCFNLNCRLHSLFFSFLLFMRSSFSGSIRGSCFKKIDISYMLKWVLSNVTLLNHVILPVLVAWMRCFELAHGSFLWVSILAWDVYNNHGQKNYCFPCLVDWKKRKYGKVHLCWVSWVQWELW